MASQTSPSSVKIEDVSDDTEHTPAYRTDGKPHTAQSLYPVVEAEETQQQTPANETPGPPDPWSEEGDPWQQSSSTLANTYQGSYSETPAPWRNYHRGEEDYHKDEDCNQGAPEDYDQQGSQDWDNLDYDYHRMV